MIMTYKARVALSVATCKPYYSHTLIAFSGAFLLCYTLGLGTIVIPVDLVLHVIYNAVFY